MRSRRRQRKCWYFITIYECPFCLGSTQIRVRQYGRRPKSWAKRHEFVTDVHWSHFA